MSSVRMAEPDGCSRLSWSMIAYREARCSVSVILSTDTVESPPIATSDIPTVRGMRLARCQHAADPGDGTYHQEWAGVQGALLNGDPHGVQQLCDDEQHQGLVQHGEDQ